MLSQYTITGKYTINLIQMITKLDEVLSHILNMNWLYHFNYNLCDFTKTIGQVFHSNEYKCVEILFSIEKWQELCWRPLY